jgi:imidazole glycerol-phosphate synthase subunit HisF
MAKPRLCFTLLYADGNFHLSRNFNLQSVGDFDWLLENYEFESIIRSIDELFILNVSSGEFDWSDYIKTIQSLIEQCFMPVAIGGGVRNDEQAKMLFDNGADKIILNSSFFINPELIKRLVLSYGAQSIVASLDIKRNDSGNYIIIIEGGNKDSGLDLAAGISKVVELGAGEIYLTSIDRDGTGMGYDMDILEYASKACDLPIIASGGADTYDRLAEGIKSGYASAVSTSHLFNFMFDGLKDARQKLINEGINLTQWNFEDLI